MSLRKWLMLLIDGKPQTLAPHGVKERLTSRQLDVADRLAEMEGVTRDDVLREAYRRDLVADYEAAEERRRLRERA